MNMPATFLSENSSRSSFLELILQRVRAHTRQYPFFHSFSEKARCCMTFTFLPIARKNKAHFRQKLSRYSAHDTDDNNGRFILWSHCLVLFARELLLIFKWYTVLEYIKLSLFCFLSRLVGLFSIRFELLFASF